ncbi:hypothetical protein Tco_0776262, partial [Tanacetum coccineum]
MPKQKKKILGGEQLTGSSSKNDVKENPFIPTSLEYDHEMILKFKHLVERHNHDNKLPNFNTRRILVLESQLVNECLKLTEVPTNPESSKESGSEPLTPLPPLKNLQGASSSSRFILKSKIDQESKIDEMTKLVQMLMDEKINSTQKI